MLPRFYLKLSLPIAIIFLTASLTARALGTMQPPNPALRGFTEGCEDKPQPCWYGIVPGVTLVEEVVELLQNSGFMSKDQNNLVVFTADAACTVTIFPQRKQELIQMIRFDGCDKSIVWGDFFTQVGLPHYKYDTDGGNWGVASDYWSAILPGQRTNILSQPVNSFQLTTFSQPPCLGLHEFASTWRLNDLEFPYC